MASFEFNAPYVKNNEKYTISESGHYVGVDGFVCPGNLGELYERFPDFIESWLFRTGRTANLTSYCLTAKDVESELVLHLMTYDRAGLLDRVGTFDPVVAGGASMCKFFGYINRLLANAVVDVIRKASRSPITSNRQPLSEEALAAFLSGSVSLQSEALVAVEQPDPSSDLVQQMDMDRFVALVEADSRELLPVLRLLMESDTVAEAYRASGLSELMFLRARKRLAVLHNCWKTGAPIPKPQRMYKPRRKKSESTVAVA